MRPARIAEDIVMLQKLLRPNLTGPYVPADNAYVLDSHNITWGLSETLTQY